jgi:hypothetical protein
MTARGSRPGRSGCRRGKETTADDCHPIAPEQALSGHQFPESAAVKAETYWWHLLAVHSAAVEVIRSKAQGRREELLEDFISLVTAFAGCPSGVRSAAAHELLLTQSGRYPPGGCR